MKNYWFWIGVSLIGISGTFTGFRYAPELITYRTLFTVFDYVSFIPGVGLVIFTDKGQSLGMPIRFLLCMGVFCSSYFITSLLI